MRRRALRRRLLPPPTGLPPAAAPAVRSVFRSTSSSPASGNRVVDRMGRIDRSRALVDSDWPGAAGLENPDQLQPDHLEQREKRDDQERPRPVAIAEEI